jgi:hypothetical protein
MVQIEWLVKTEKDVLNKPSVAEMLKELNGGYIKIIKAAEEEIVIALPVDPKKVNLPNEIKRERVKNDHSCYEKWKQRREDKEDK